MNIIRKRFAVAGTLLGALVAGGLFTAFAAAIFTPDDTSPIGYLGQPAVSSSNVQNGLETIYTIDYKTSDWSGNLHSYPLTSGGAIVETDNWAGGAGAKIDDQHWDTGRYIVSMNGTSKIRFRWENLSSAQKVALDSATAAVVGETSSPILNYVRGDRSNQSPSGLNYRPRSHVLGDIIHSTPVYCGADKCGSKTVFVGANDGMIHAIDAEAGTERFAYIPSMLIPKLSKLKDLPYVHTYYVDGRVHVRKFGNQTILVGGLGAGGKGLFGLDVTNASPTSEQDAANKILWETTNTGDFANLGYTYGAPTLFNLPDGTSSGTPALVVANGYNNTGNGHAVLYLINPVSGALIHAFDTGAGSAASPNGLSSPSIWDSDGDGKPDTAYAGDIDGNLWKFKLTDPYTITRLHTTDPVQAITSAPGLMEHPLGGVMVTFVTGRLFTQADKVDQAYHYVYGIWDSAPAANTALLEQTLTEDAYAGVSPSIRVRKSTNNLPTWRAGAGNHKGWKTRLPIGGERLVGDGAFITGGLYQFMSTNPTINPSARPPGENWWMVVNALTGGAISSPKIDLNRDGVFTSLDQLSGGINPIGRHMGGGTRSQLIGLSAVGGKDVYQASYDKNDLPVTVTEVVTENRGVAGGHFDMEIFYFDNLNGVKVTLGASQTKTVCARTSDVQNEYNQVSSLDTLPPSDSFCRTGNGFGSTYKYMTNYVTGSSCGSGKRNQSITCNQYTSAPAYGGSGDYSIHQHVHEYDDIYDVTGVNMLNASKTSYNLSPRVLPDGDTSTPFKILLMNQYLNAAAKVRIDAVGGEGAYESVKTYKNLASETDASALLSGLPTYTRSTLGYLTFNLPIDAFSPKDWWGDGGTLRAGLIPTDHWCVDGVAADGAMRNENRGYNDSYRRHTGLIGPNGERLNGALTIQIIRANTPPSALELNHNQGNVKYGWRVKQSEFRNYVIAEYSTYWHHPNEICYGENGWVPNPPRDTTSDATSLTRAAGSDDPRDGNFITGTGSTAPVPGTTTVTNTTTNPDGSTVTVTVVTLTRADGTTTVTTTTTTIGSRQGIETGGELNPGGQGNPTCNPETDVNCLGSPPLEATRLGRINWRELQQ